MEDVRGLRAEGPALLHPEPVLLVDNRHREGPERDLLLDQRVRPDGDRGFTRRERGAGGRMFPGRQRAREQHDRHPELGADALEGQEMLLGEGLGRRHERSLMAPLDRTQKRVESHHGLARADVPLEEPLHGLHISEVVSDLRDCRLLLGRQLERQDRVVAGDEVSVGAEAGRDGALLESSSPPQKADLEQEELVEGQP